MTKTQTTQTAINEAYNEATRTLIHANDAVRAAESMLARAQDAARSAELARNALVALIKLGDA